MTGREPPAGRFFVTADQVRGDEVMITGGDARHILAVLRRRVGDRLLLIGPDGSEWLATIVATTPEPLQVYARIVERRRPQREPLTRVTIAQALIKGDKFDWVVQKATELGAHAFLPFAATRSVLRLAGQRADKRLERWRRIA
ncbi:MAG TPA: RsmE family RNA methyltransferase, partial [Bacillota bacterium]